MRQKSWFALLLVGLLLFRESDKPDFVNSETNSPDFSFIKKLSTQDQLLVPAPSPKYSAPTTLRAGQHHVATLRFSAQVTNESAIAIIGLIKQANSAGAEYVVLEINSPGGSVGAGFEISRAIEKSTAPVFCVVDQSALSMGYFMLQSCSVRLMTKRSFLMIHAPSISGHDMSGDQSAFKNLYAQLHALTEAMLEHFSYRTTIPIDEMRSRIADGKEWWVNWDEALRTRMVDGIVLNSYQVYVALLNGARLPVNEAN